MAVLTLIILPLVGGLGLFLYGMHMMGEGIEKAAGAKLRSILEFFTRNTLSGLAVGFLFTAIIQSSSACTSMVVSFVNSGIMDLYQAVGVIFGANIGTTVTSQLVSFDLADYAPILVLAGVIMLLFFKKIFVQKIGEILAGFGILFLGLNNMSSAMGTLHEIPGALDIFSAVSNPILALLVGTLVTAVVQSSSVTVSIILLMATQDLLDLPTCLFMIQGCNIGACATALLSSVGGKKDAKRAAMIHLLFNGIGTLFFIIFLTFGMDWFIDTVLALSNGNKGRFVANAHTIVKITQVIVLLPFTKVIVKLTHLFVRGEDEKIGYRQQLQLKYIGGSNVFSPATAVVDVSKELERMAYLASENLNRAMNALITLDEDDIEEVYHVEENINFLNHEITNYLVKISQTNLPVEDAKSIGGLFHVVNDIERIGDHAENVADSARMRIKTGCGFSPEAIKEMTVMLEMVNTLVQYAVEMFRNDSSEHLEDIKRLEDEVDRKEREYQQNHVDRMTRGECKPEGGMIFSDVISGLERVADHATNIAFAIYNNDN
ncbi:MAG: Na/Pi cotransporter family protein [Lachnospiraceae bacterium]|nr:Na/Pi cotransporter family protein [Lachnospiraceae bacterium]